MRLPEITAAALQISGKGGISGPSISRSHDILRQAAPRGALLPCRMEAYRGSFTA